MSNVDIEEHEVEAKLDFWGLLFQILEINISSRVELDVLIWFDVLPWVWVG